MKKFSCIICLVVLPLFVLSFQTQAKEEKFVVDEADSLDFESFHKEKEGEQSTSLFGISGGTSGIIREGENVFHPELDNPGKNIGVIEEDLSTPKKRKSANDFNTKRLPQPKGKIRNIRVRYALYKSDYTPLHAHDAVPVLHSYINDYCPTGWLKLAEWSLPVERDHFLYYQFQCLNTK